MNTHHEVAKTPLVLKIVSGVSILSTIGLGGLAYVHQSKIAVLTSERINLENQVSSLQKDLETASTTAAELNTTIASLTSTKANLTDKLTAEQNKNEGFALQINKIAGTVGKLDKLSQTDKELLQKYSKVYFLNENYIPSRLSLIKKTYLAPGHTEIYFHTSALPFLNDMIEAADDDGVSLTIVSAYRSFESQADLKSTYKQTFGSGANTFSADQGYSEHQLGTTADFSTKDQGANIDSFGSTKAFTWMQANAYKYGFILSYPKDNSFYVYEPWHWRFVGTDLARALHDDKANFYDWEQRKIDTYLISVFD